jgi:hypothetical protein
MIFIAQRPGVVNLNKARRPSREGREGRPEGNGSVEKEMYGELPRRRRKKEGRRVSHFIYIYDRRAKRVAKPGMKQRNAKWLNFKDLSFPLFNTLIYYIISRIQMQHFFEIF